MDLSTFIVAVFCLVTIGLMESVSVNVALPRSFPTPRSSP
jgi:hypothetical protein